MGTKHYLHAEFEELMAQPETLEFLDLGAVDGFWYWDLKDPEHEWMSEGFWITLGFDPSTKEHLASEWQDLIYPEDRARAMRNFERHCDDPRYPYDQLVRYKTSDGGTVVVRCRGKAIRENGEPIRLLGTHTVLHDTRQESIDATLNGLLDTVVDGMIGWTETGRVVHWSPSATELYGYAPHDRSPVFPPDLLRSDYGMPWDEVSKHLATGEAWRGQVRHVSSDGRTIITNTVLQRIEITEGQVCIFQIDRDETQRVEAEEAKHLMNREPHHRVKNLFGVVQGLIRMTAHGDAAPGLVAEELSARVSALASAHILSMSGGETRPIPFREMLETLLAPFMLADVQVEMEGPDFEVAVEAINPLGLTLHELATNALKYGAWSDRGGRVNITWDADQTIRFEWKETLIRAGLTPPKRDGFGTQLIAKSVAQLRGQSEINWNPEGLLVKLKFPRQLIDRNAPQRFGVH